uniref:Uncharacterized protein LOC105130143 n=1 Tax=Rhizophora mucronata TaxID=61149 RepID=A0A2P2LA88_RHIMU
MEGASAKLTATLVMELHPGLVLVKARTFPFHCGVLRRGSPYKLWQEIYGAVEVVDDWP